jgi:hypothetical protein
MRKNWLATIFVWMFGCLPPMASAQWNPVGPYTFVQGQSYDLFFAQPALDNFLSLDLFVRYPTTVFEPVALLSGAPSSLASLLDVIASPPSALGSGIDEVYIAVGPSSNAVLGQYGVNLPAGSMFGVRFSVKGGELPNPNPVVASVAFTLTLGDPPLNPADDPLFQRTLALPGSANVSATIAAIPEPATWATMFAGLTLVAIAAARARRRSG